MSNLYDSTNLMRGGADWITDYIYCVEAVGTDLVKIGVSICPEDRIIAHRTGSPVPLRMLGYWPARRKKEAEIHQMFAHLWSHGEWFHYKQELKAYVEFHAGIWDECWRDSAEILEYVFKEHGINPKIHKAAAREHYIDARKLAVAEYKKLLRKRRNRKPKMIMADMMIRHAEPSDGLLLVGSM